MSQQLLNYFLLSLGAAVNFPALTVVIGALYQSHGNQKTLNFILGSEIILLVIGLIGVSIAPGFLDFNIKDKFSAEFDLYLGIILFFLAIYNLLHKEKLEKKNRKNESSTGKYLVIGLFLTVTNVNTLLLYVAALKNVIQISNITIARFGLVLLSSTIVNLMTIVPLVINILSPDLTKKILVPINSFFQIYRRTIITVVLFLLSFLMFLRYFG